MTNDLRREGPHFPSEPRAVKRLERAIELGELEDLTGIIEPRGVPRYLVTFMKSETSGRIRSGTVVSVTNQSEKENRVTVTYYKGFTDNTTPVGQTTFSIPPDFTVDFASRDLPTELTVCNSVPNPELVFDEGRAIVSSSRPDIGVSARVYYTRDDSDLDLLAITDSKVVRFAEGNVGD